MSHEKRGLFLGCFHKATNDKGKRYFPAVPRVEGLWDSWDERWNQSSPRRKIP